jgi:hypothetical protein
MSPIALVAGLVAVSATLEATRIVRRLPNLPPERQEPSVWAAVTLAALAAISLLLLVLEFF